MVVVRILDPEYAWTLCWTLSSGTGERANWYSCVWFQLHSVTPSHTYKRLSRNTDHLAKNLSPPLRINCYSPAVTAEQRVWVASHMALDLCDMGLGDDVWNNLCVSALPEGSQIRFLPEAYPRSFCPYRSSTFYK